MKGGEKAGSKKRVTKYTPPASSETKRVIKAVPKNDGQKNLLRAVDANTVTIVTGPPGSGKTYIPVSYGLQMFTRGRYKRIIITRPFVEAGEHLGFLPGSKEEKVAPFLQPIFDVLGDHLSQDDIQKMIEEGTLVIQPLAYMRGITFRDAFVMCDEAQNMTKKQIHMLLTRIGEGSKVVVGGDTFQNDLGKASGLKDAMTRLQGVEGLEVVELDASCIVRHPIVAAIDKRYAEEA